VSAGSRCNIGQRPRRLELEIGHLVVLQKADEDWHNARLDDLSDGRVFLQREEATEASRGLEHHCGIRHLDVGEEGGDLMDAGLRACGGRHNSGASSRSHRLDGGEGGRCFRMATALLQAFVLRVLAKLDHVAHARIAEVSSLAEISLEFFVLGFSHRNKCAESRTKVFLDAATRSLALRQASTCGRHHPNLTTFTRTPNAFTSH
jgi:hypothetical protein